MITNFVPRRRHGDVLVKGLLWATVNCCWFMIMLLILYLCLSLQKSKYLCCWFILFSKIVYIIIYVLRLWTYAIIRRVIFFQFCGLGLTLNMLPLFVSLFFMLLFSTIVFKKNNILIKWSFKHLWYFKTHFPDRSLLKHVTWSNPHTETIGIVGSWMWIIHVAGFTWSFH